MGVFKDIWRLMRVGREQSAKMDFTEALHESANLAETWANVDWNQPIGTHGAATANPFANLSFLNSAIPAAGTVVSLAPTERKLGETPIYRVELEMKIDGHELYRTSYETVIAAGALPNWQPGKMLTFRVSPEDPHSIMLG